MKECALGEKRRNVIENLYHITVTCFMDLWNNYRQVVVITNTSWPRIHYSQGLGVSWVSEIFGTN